MRILLLQALIGSVDCSQLTGTRVVSRSIVRTAGQQQNSAFEKLRWASRDCVRESYARFEKDNIGRDKEGSWVAQDRFAVVQASLQDVKLVEGSEIFNLIETAPWPIWLNLTDSFEGHQSTSYEFSLFSVPAGQTLQPRRHPAGTIVLFKKLLGSCQMRTLINTREINKLELEDNILIRLAGTTKVFDSLEGATTAVFELAIFPPRRLDEGFGSESGFSSEAKELICRMDIGTSDGNSIFESAAAAAEVEERRLEEAERLASSTGMDRTYDVLSKMRGTVGGLGPELKSLVRRILVSRQLPVAVFKDLGISHVKGLLLHGPPGCGKTLIARELARALNAKEPIVVNGPEVLSKYIGEAESNIRMLFTEAEAEWKVRGIASSLHIIIFDEFDAIGRSRGTSRDASGVRDSCVNQLLTLLDGTREMNNILVVALTNRKDMLDAALLRPGRLEVHLEIGLPTAEGREDILDILFAPLVEEGYVTGPDRDRWIPLISRRTGGASGATLAGVMRNAASHAIGRWQQDYSQMAGPVPTFQLTAGRGYARGLRYEWGDFDMAMEAIND